MYRQIASGAGLPVAQMIRTAEFEKALSEQEQGVRMARDGTSDYFAQPLGRALLLSFDSLCALRGHVIAEEQGPNAAIAFVEERVQLCDYLSTSPLLQMLLYLGNLYFESGAKDRAATCFERIIQAEPVDIIDAEGSEAETRSMAANNLRIITGRGVPSRSTGSGCMLLVTALALTLMGAGCIWILL